MKLTKEEKQAIKSLERLARNWPETLWLFSAAGILHIVKKADGERVRRGTDVARGMSYDQDYSIAAIDIPNDGGDW